MSTTVDIDPTLLQELRTFRLKKSSSKTAAAVVKIDKKKLLMVMDEIYDSTTLDELVEELPEHSPRFIVLSYELHHEHGRISYPLVLINWAPASSSIELATLYASALQNFSVHADVGKVIDIRDGELSDTILRERLGVR
ncbi:hypothetical protein MVES1_002472 [Malassezia vespertilionis]|uniref:uncharacterized protein n=1 Tax=Malassezia vespertilionis TaxID=2020962 RepID=UPI0024B0C35D|nr:uncharacterized protein MVES1_002472 [Malassezia vespertilionis]WFD07115.1 hypothetical protein MVES1_002472 [Malassezia vespertilionis]